MAQISHPSEYDPDPSFIEVIEQNYPDLRKRVKKTKFAMLSAQVDELYLKAKEYNPKHYLMIRFQLETGLRVSEVINLTIPQLNLAEGVFHVEERAGDRYASSYSPKTASSVRPVGIPVGLIDLLVQHIGKRKRGYVFFSNKGKGKKPYRKQSVIAFINKYANECDSIGRNIGSHALRRTFASFQMRKGTEIHKISKALGHSSIRTTMRYLFYIYDLEEVKEIARTAGEISRVPY